MRIAVFDNLPEGGAKRVVYEEIRSLSQNHEIFYYTNSHVSIFPFEKYAKKILRYDFTVPAYSGWNRPLRELLLYTKVRGECKKLATQIIDDQCDVALVHPCQLTQAPQILQFLEIPSLYFLEELPRVVYEPQLFPLPEVSFVKKLYEQLRRTLLKHTDRKNTQQATKIAVASKFVAAQVRRAYSRKTLVCPLGVDERVFKPLKNNKRSYFLFVGERTRVNGYLLLQSALRLLPKQISIKFISFKDSQFGYSDSQMNELYNKALATLCLSQREPFGLVAIESLAVGTPVIAVNEGGYRETVRNKGTLISRNPKELARALEQSQQLPVSCYYFSWKTHCEAIEEYLKALARS